MGMGRWLAVGALVSLVLGAAQGQPTEIYTCIDKDGRRLTSDRPIPACADREQRVLDRSGAERRRVGPTLTEHEREAQEVQRRREVQERVRQIEERRRERLLLLRYPDEAAHRKEREAAQEQANAAIDEARRRIVELQTELARLREELEFYRGDFQQAPPKLQGRKREIDEASALQQHFITQQQQKKQRIDQRFDAELEQLRRLWAGEKAGAGKS